MEEINSAMDLFFNKISLYVRAKTHTSLYRRFCQLYLREILGEEVSFSFNQNTYQGTYQVGDEKGYIYCCFSEKESLHVPTLKDDLALKTIIFSNVEPVKRNPNYTYHLQLPPYSPFEEGILAKLESSPPFPPHHKSAHKELRPYQVEDLLLLQKYTKENIDQNYLSALIQQPMGAGKTVLFSEYLSWIIRERYQFDCYVVVSPKLLINDQNFETIRSQNHGNNCVYFGFDSGKVNGLTSSTKVGDLQSFFQKKSNNRESKIILTTYVSLPGLTMHLHERTVLYIFDEVHRCKDLPSYGGHHVVGFTATPTRETLQHLTPLVTRTIKWAIDNRVLVDYEICPIYGLGQTDSGIIENIIRENYSKKILYVSSSQKQASHMTQELQHRNINAVTITSDEVNGKSNKRHELEQSIKKSATGVLSTVAMYREGADLPWLDGIFLGIDTVNEISTTQILGRGLRHYPGKERCRIYVPFRKDLESIANLAWILLSQEPNGHSITLPKIRFIGGPDLTPKVEALIRGKVDETYGKTYQKKEFTYTWKFLTGACLIRSIPLGETFGSSSIREHGQVLRDYYYKYNLGRGKGNGDSSLTMNREFTQFFVGKKYVNIVGHQTYQLNPVKYQELLEMIGPIPDDFPIMIKEKG